MFTIAYLSTIVEYINGLINKYMINNSVILIIIEPLRNLYFIYWVNIIVKKEILNLS